MSNTLKIYINGIETQSVTGGNATLDPGSSLRVGNWILGNRNWGGCLDELRIWDKALTSAEISNNYNIELGSNETDLILYYDFNQGVANGNNTGLTTAIDRTGNGFDGILTDFVLNGNTSNWVGSTVPISQDDCPIDPNDDIDGDEICGDVDNCPDDANPGQADMDSDGLGDVCDPAFTLGATVNQGVIYIAGLGLNSGQTNALTYKLQDILTKYCNGQITAALNKATAFINQVQAFESSGIITSADAAYLIGLANTIIDAINDPSITIECPGNMTINPFPRSHFNADILLLKLFPNPANDMISIHVQGLKSQDAELTILDHLGREFYRRDLAPGEEFLEIQLNEGKYASGEYFIRIISSEGILTNKFIVLH